MKIIALVIRILLGLAFLLSGIMAFMIAFHVMANPDQSTGLAADFNRALGESRYMLGVAAVEVVGGVLLLIGRRFAPLGLLMIGPVIVNIAFYHIFLDHEVKNAIPGVVIGVLSLVLLYCYRHAFAGLVRES